MILRDYCLAEKAVIVEKFNADNKEGCIVRFDLKPVMKIVPLPGNQDKTMPEIIREKLYRSEPSGFMEFSVLTYKDIPEASAVIADIRASLAEKYPGTTLPEIDFEQYRTAIANL